MPIDYCTCRHEKSIIIKPRSIGISTMITLNMKCKRCGHKVKSKPRSMN